MKHISAAAMGREIASGKIDPVEAAESCFEKIGNSRIQDAVFARLTYARAIKEAEAARTRQKNSALLGPLDGVPVSWKDLFDTAGIQTESGTPLLKGRVPDADCEVLRRATAAGTICVGKTHLSELAFSGLGINPNTGTPPNIHDPNLAPGGSSSGAAASVAFGFVPIGIGSDTGGSVRIPSAWNDLVGLKTTAGLVPNRGVVSLCPSFDTVGPLCLTVEDAALMHGVLTKGDVKPPKEKPLSKCRFLVSETVTLEGCETEQLKGFEEAVEALAKAGAKIERGPVEEFEKTSPLSIKLFPYEAYQSWGAEIDANPGVVFAPVESRFGMGRDISRGTFEQVWCETLLLRETYVKRVSDYDAVLAPTVAIGPPNVEALLNDHDAFSSSNLLALRNTRFGNTLGLCALTLPTNKPASGIMFLGLPLTEELLLSIGLSAEKIVRTI